MKRIASVIAVLAVAVLVGPAGAEEYRVTQQDKTFSATTLKIKTGDRIVFFNADSVTHNVFSVTKGHEFEIRTQLPGKSDTVPFPRGGELDVLCAIHPRMKLHVQVEP